ncbi:hypothetical protein K438DRAFT_1764530 [Mycena galopus ATCC 62051]|nr:hypothetical protein K438DRAFT_1764530 [Mycena galopus ATCC 62051]
MVNITGLTLLRTDNFTRESGPKDRLELHLSSTDVKVNNVPSLSVGDGVSRQSGTRLVDSPASRRTLSYKTLDRVEVTNTRKPVGTQAYATALTQHYAMTLTQNHADQRWEQLRGMLGYRLGRLVARFGGSAK